MSDLDKLKALFARLLQPLERRIDYFALYEAEVVAQHEDGSLELQPFAEEVRRKLPPLNRIAVRYGVPGITAKVKEGGSVLVGFAQADPKKPYALIFDSAAVESISVLGGDRPVARLGDAVRVNFPPLIPISGTIGGAPFVATATIVTAGIGQIITARKDFRS